MGKETEHKYIVISDSFKDMAESSSRLAQGYLSREPDRTVRVRIKDDKGFLTVKGRTYGDSRLEFEYEVPVEDAHEMLCLCEEPVVEKIRYYVPFGGFTWEVDEFEGQLAGITVAEIELPESGTVYERPDFVGREVTNDPRWFNSQLHKHVEELKQIRRQTLSQH